MTQEKISLASDNFAPAHPSIIEAVVQANVGYAPAYGLDVWTAKAEERIQQAFGLSPKVLFVPSGTGANVLALKLACKRYESVICTDIAHLYCQESGSPESVVGCKLLPVSHREGKLVVENVLGKLKAERAFGKHTTSPRVLSITQPTEVGTLYTIEEMRDLARLCKEENLLLHVDGSRLYNALAALPCSIHEMFNKVSVDILSLGGTKNGLMGAEALVIFNPLLHEGADHIHKQSLLLVSKMRYFAAQYIPFFENELWRTLASHANQKALEIADIIRTTPRLSLTYPVETNQIFFTAPVAWIPLIQEKIYSFVWEKEKNEMRFIASWNTSEKDVEAVRVLLKTISA